MNPVASRSDDSFRPLQVAGTIRQTTVAVVQPTPNVVSSIIESGSPKPHATVSNPMVAQVDSYTPPPGRNMAHYLAIDVDKAGDSRASVADAMQRYLNVAPTRKPGGAPRDIASLDSPPSLIMAEDAAWSEPHPYKFSVNGVVQRQVQPTFYTQGGSTRVRVVGPVVAAIQTPATEGVEPLQVGPMPAGAYYPPALAAQLSMRRLTDLYDESGKMEVQTVGPELNPGPNETLPKVAATLAPMREALGARISESVKSGMSHFANLGIYSQSPQLYLTALAARA